MVGLAPLMKRRRRQIRGLSSRPLCATRQVYSIACQLQLKLSVIKQASYERLFALTRHAWHWSVVAPHVEAATLAEVEGFVRELLQK
eukprot:622163-Pelagomonas_calceolata.AAC.2